MIIVKKMLLVSSLFLLFILENTRSEVVDFLDCGHGMEIKKVTFGNCSIPPCRVRISEQQSISIDLEVVDPVPFFKNMQLVARLSQMNIPWDLPISPDNPCTTWNCPLNGPARNQKVNANMNFNHLTILRPGRLRILGTVLSFPDPIFCVELSVILTAA